MDEQDRGDYEPLNSDQSSQSPPPATAQDYASESAQAGSYAHAGAPANHPPIVEDHDGGHRNLIISLVALAILALIAGAVYWFSLRHKPSTPLTTATQTTTSSQTKPAATAIDATTKNYTSPNFNLGFSYPADWTVADNGGGMMSVKSPALSLTTVSGSQQGIILLIVRDHAQALPEFTKGNATATRDSQKVAYTNPTSNQRANTFLSFLQYASTTTHAALDGIYITGDNGYQKGQNIPGADVGKADPRISITFTDASGKAMNIADKAWDDTSFSTPLIKMLESFSIN